jgi:CheY-like chemotaxis protein
MPTGKKTLLYIDDSPDDLFLFQKACSQASVSFHLESVDSGQEGIAYLEGAHKYADRSKFPFPDIVLLDLKMPPPDGFDILRWIRKDSRYDRLSVCVFSSSFQYEDIQTVYAEHADCFLTKPPTLDRLTAIAGALDRCLTHEAPRLDWLKELPEFRQ